LFCHFQVLPADASEVTENSGDGAEAAAPSSGDGAEAAAPTSPSSPRNKKRRKSGKAIFSEDECLSQALHFMRRMPDDFDTFGEYVAMELRSLSSAKYQKKLKSEIRQCISRNAELDDLYSMATSSTNTTEAP
jgi:hypothetical protein